ncbi:FtsK/SpoIIIE domain-containing protein [Nonomuraea sp. SBT364]|uniref:FtsK/SpoIIIE domain-containing protein n=1 Tax=Nonomuraea sp. SBT364 TaxID=1580530 RepID=UPI00066B30BC|nr:FtsK/SpoIIIE domain-containing protein [Nonomuraea sp. SBT364]
MNQPERRLRIVPKPEDAPPLYPPHPDDPEQEEDMPDGHELALLGHADVTPIEPTRVWSPRRTITVVTAPIARQVDVIRHEHGGLLRVGAKATRASVAYGSIGLGRAAGAWWRWVTAADHEQALASKPEFVAQERARRRKVSLGALAAGLLGDLGLWLFMDWPWWGAPAILLGVTASAGGAAEFVMRRRAENAVAADDEVVRGIGTHPNSKAVRRLFVAAKLAKRIEDVKVIAPGVVRDAIAWMCEVELPGGGTYDEALKQRARLAAASGRGLSRLYVDKVPDHEGRVRLWSPDRDPLSAPKVDCELKGRTTPVDVWTERVPLGLTVRGAPMGFSMPGRSLLVGGEPEAGKSVACNILLCFAALDPSVELWLADGKGVDLLDYEDLAHRSVLRPDPEALLEMIQESIEDMEEKGAQLAKLRVKKLTKELAEELGWSMSLLHVDELAYFTTHPEFGAKITEALRDHVSRGRYVGKFTSAATQRPSGKVVDTELRDLLSIRLALRCNTPQASDMILGQGWASRGHNAQLIDASQRGSGLLFAEGSTPVTGRTGFLDDPDVTRLARTAYKLRESAGTLPVTDTHPGRMLLEACVAACGEAEKIWTSELLPRLAKDQTWAHLVDDPAELARLLRPYGVAPGQVWISDGRGSGANRQGYTRSGFTEALNRLHRR